MSAAVPLSFELFNVALVVILGALFAAMPSLTRPSLYFAVTVAPSFRKDPEGRRILAGYRKTVVAGTVVCGALALLIRPSAHPVTGSMPPVLLIGMAVGAFLLARRSVLPHAQAPATVWEAEVAAHRTSMPGGAVVQASPFVILAVAAGLLFLRWHDIPSRFPVHWGVDGRPNGWAARTAVGVFGSLLTAAVVCALLLLVAWVLTRWSRRMAATGSPAIREARFRRAVLWVLLGSEVYLAAVGGWVSLIPVLGSQDPRLITVIVPVMTVLAVVALVLVFVKMGQGGSRLAVKETLRGEGETGLGDGTADRMWKAGLIYFNRDDPAVFVEKRFGIGYTVNFGNPWAWVVLSLVVAVPVLLGILL